MIKLIKLYDEVGNEIIAPKTIDRLNILLNSAIIPRIGETIYFCDEDYEQIEKDYEENNHCFNVNETGFQVGNIIYYTDGRVYENEDALDCFLIGIFDKLYEQHD